MTPERHRVVVTGVGLVTALGEGREVHASALSRGAEAPAELDAYAPWAIRPLPALDLDRQIPRRGDQRQMEPWQRLGTYAAGLALDDAGARDLAPEMHLVVAAGGGERDVALDEAVSAELMAADDPARLNERLAAGLRPTLFLAQLSNLLAGNVSIVHGVTGSSRTLMGEEVAGADALRIARARLAEGRGGIALVGGAFSAARWDMILLYAGGGGLRRGPPAPVSAAEGLTLGSLAAFLVLETEANAAARGARPLARLDAVSTGAARRRAPGEAAASLREQVARAAPGGAGAVISAASGAPGPTREEAAALAALGLPVRRPASLIGHGVEAAFPAAAALAALALSGAGLHAALDPADPPGPLDPDRILVTGLGQWRGEAAALLSRAGA